MSAKVRHVSSDADWWLTTVFGPVREADRTAFFEELHALRQARLGSWMICGDFNMIYHSQDKTMVGCIEDGWVSSAGLSMRRRLRKSIWRVGYSLGATKDATRHWKGLTGAS
jgi:hypothetical protein